MINYLNIRNFRSIVKSEVRFSKSGLSVIIGANGSGKSNLIKALELLSEICRSGLADAIYANGGSHSVIPKAVPQNCVNKCLTEVEYSVTPPPLRDYPKNHPTPSIEHKLTLQPSKRESMIVASEVLRFNQPLSVSRALQSSKKDVVTGVIDSCLSLNRDASTLSLSYVPDLTHDNIADYYQWLGVPAFISGVDSSDRFEQSRDLLRALLHADDDAYPSSKSLIERGPIPLSLSSHYSVFRDSLSAIRRFDFHLRELRSDQQITSDSAISPEGRNMPSAVRYHLAAKKPRGISSWSRIHSTLVKVAPHVLDAKVKPQHGGKEYIEFVESKLGRPVESWDSSDGTLRALAILIALESHPPHSTILIEEPEQGLHPWAISFLVEHIRDAISRRSIQVILTTHSQQVLESVEPSEVLLAQRTSAEGTSYCAISDIKPNHSIEKGDVGRLWVKGLLGAIPSYD